MIACIEMPIWLAIGFVVVCAIVVSALIVVLSVTAAMVYGVVNDDG